MTIAKEPAFIPTPVTVRAAIPGVGWVNLPNYFSTVMSPPQWEHADPGGPAKINFALAGEYRLIPGTPLQVLDGALPVWAGEIESSEPDPRDHTTRIVGRGPADNMQDAVTYDKTYVHSDLTKFVDNTSLVLGTTRGNTNPSGKVQIGDGIIDFSMALGMTFKQSQSIGPAAVLDLGPNNLMKRVVLVYESSATWSASTLFIVKGHTSPDWLGVAGSENAYATTPAAGPTTVAYTFAGSFRYLHLFPYWTAVDGVAGQMHWLKVTSCFVFTAAAYESGNASILKVDQVAADIVANAGIPNISTRSDLIAAGTLAIPELISGGDNPRSLLERANAGDGRQWLFSNDAPGALIVRSVPVVTRWVMNTGEYAIDGGLTTTIQDVYNEVDVHWTAANGSKNVSTVTLTPDTTILARLSRTRTGVVKVQRVCTSAEAAGIGAAFLRENLNPPMRAAVRTTKGYIRTAAGSRMPVSMITVGDLIAIRGMRDPATGQLSRNGVIKAVTIDKGTNIATISLDNDRNVFDRQLARFEALAGGR